MHGGRWPALFPVFLRQRKEVDGMTTYEAISLVAQFGIVILALVGIIVELQNKKK